MRLKSGGNGEVEKEKEHLPINSQADKGSIATTIFSQDDHMQHFQRSPRIARMGGEGDMRSMNSGGGVSVTAQEGDRTRKQGRAQE